jgi:hypothetical protein
LRTALKSGSDQTDRTIVTSGFTPNTPIEPKDSVGSRTPLQCDPTPDRLNNRHVRLRPPTLSIDRHVKPTLCQIPSQPNQSIQFVGAVREPPVLWPVSSANLPADFGENIQHQYSVMKALNAPSFMMHLKIASLPLMRSNGSVSKCRQKPKSKTVSLLQL